jgi:hypothetical protein
MSSLFSTGVRPIIDEFLLVEAAKTRDYGSYWSASSAGYCMRKVIFERLGVPHVVQEDAARKQRVFTAGHIFHNWVQELARNAGVSVAQEIELQDEDLMVRGHFDDLVVIGGNPILYDYKTRNSRNFSFAKTPSYFHRLQLGTYMLIIRRLQAEEVKPTWLDSLPLLEESRTLNIEKDTLRQAEMQYLWDAELEADVLAYWNELNHWWKVKKLPPCTCADHENGFMAREKWNNYFYEGEPCSVQWYELWKEGQKHAAL